MRGRKAPARRRRRTGYASNLSFDFVFHPSFAAGDDGWIFNVGVSNILTVHVVPTREGLRQDTHDTDDQRLAASLGGGGARRAREFDWDSVTARLVDVYRGVLRGAGTPGAVNASVAGTP